MSEYIVDVGDMDKEHVEMFGKKATTIFGNPIKGEIVRCRDCKYCEVQTVSYYSSNTFFVCLADWCEGSDHDNPTVESDGFCAWGEKKC